MSSNFTKFKDICDICILNLECSSISKNNIKEFKLYFNNLLLPFYHKDYSYFIMEKINEITNYNYFDILDKIKNKSIKKEDFYNIISKMNILITYY